MHLNQIVKEDNKSHDKEEEQYMALRMEKSVEKHRMKKKQYEAQYWDQCNKSYPHGSSSNHYQHKHGSALRNKTNVNNIRSPCIEASSTGSSKEDNLVSQKVKPQSPPVHPTSQKLLVTKNKTTSSRPDIAARTKDLRLKGSDIYVARLGTCPIDTANPIKYAPEIPSPRPTSLESGPSSLYDELSPLSRMPHPSMITLDLPTKKPEIRASRPCYRCVTAMHAVGIKRAFWTNADGEWEGAKVRDLVEALEIGGRVPGYDDGGDKGIFVTKHEVLLLKRVMGI